MLAKLEIASSDLPPRTDRAGWPTIRDKLTTVFSTKSRDHWAAVFADSDACVSPVLSMTEARENDHLKARGTFVDVNGAVRPAAAPRFSRSPIAHSNTDVTKVHARVVIDGWRE